MSVPKYILLILVCTAVACGVLEYRQKDDMKTISMEDALYDYDYMWHVLENNYPLLHAAERKYLLSAEELKEAYRAEIENLDRKEIPFYRYYEIIQECIGNFRRFGHLNVLTPDGYQGMYGLVREYPSAGSLEPWLRWQKDLLSDQAIQKRYAYLAEVYGKSSGRRGESDDENVLFRDISENIGYIKIKSFGAEHREHDQKILEEWFRKNADKEFIIIDITGNGGGTDYYWMELLVAPNIDEDVEQISYWITPYGEESREQFALCGITREELSAVDEKILSLPNVNRQDLEEAGYYRERHLVVSPKYEEKICKGKFFVLVDGSVYSAADGFAGFCKDTGFAKLVGQNTKGDGGGANVFLLDLPKSNLAMRFRAMNSLNSDGSSNVEYGTAPDVEAVSPQGNALDPLDVCLKEIRDGQ